MDRESLWIERDPGCQAGLLLLPIVGPSAVRQPTGRSVPWKVLCAQVTQGRVERRKLQVCRVLTCSDRDGVMMNDVGMVW